MRMLAWIGFACAATATAAAPEWTAYGGDGRGQRHAPVAQITPQNVARLEVAWAFRTGELGEDFARAHDALTRKSSPEPAPTSSIENLCRFSRSISRKSVLFRL